MARAYYNFAGGRMKQGPGRWSVKTGYVVANTAPGRKEIQKERWKREPKMHLNAMKSIAARDYDVVDSALSNRALVMLSSSELLKRAKPPLRWLFQY